MVTGCYLKGRNPLVETMRTLRLAGHRSWEKFVPACYLWNSPDVRLAVLRGLLDTDGTILHHSHSVSFATTSERLAEDVIFLVQSLGGVAPMRMRQTHYPYKGERRAGRPSYHVNVCLPNGVMPFRLQRKAERVRDKGQRNRARRFIVGVERAGEGGSTCLSVAHPSGLFVIHDFIVTHNSTAGIVATLRHAMRYGPAVWPIKWAVIRDTWENIKITTMDTIRMFCRKYKIPAQGLELKEPKIVQLGMQTESSVFKPLVELHFFGLDQPSDANRLQGFEGAGAWIEEPAPAADLASGVPEDALLAVTSLRQGSIEGVQPRVQITFNPPDETHWTIKYRDDQDTIDAMEAQGISIDFFEIPPGENPGITKEYRQRNRAMLEAMGRPDLVARLVEGKVGFLQLGVSVTPEYSSLHESKISLPILRRVPIIRSFDFGLNPTTVWLQETPHGRVYIFKSIRGEHMGMENHIQSNVIPWQIAHGIQDYMFEDYGDPNGLSPEAKNSNVSAVTAIEEMLTASPGVPASFTPGPIPIADRVGPIRALLRRMNKFGQPVIQVDPEATEMRRALGGGWHRKKSASGIISDILKDEHSEHCDALGYALGCKHPIAKLIERPRKPQPRRSNPVGIGGDRSWMTT